MLRLESLETGTAGLLVDFVRVVSGGMPSPPETAWADLAVINDSRGGRALKNGGFEQAIGDHTTDPDNSGPTGNEHLSGNSLPGWRVTRENVDVIRFNNANPPEGANALDTGGHGPGGIAQTITGLVPGGAYELSFQHARHAGWGSADMTGAVRINGQLVASLVRTISQTWNDGYEFADTGLYRKVKVRVSTLDSELVAWVYVLDAAFCTLLVGVTSMMTLRSASRTTGTSSPRSVSTATPTCIAIL